MKKISPRHPQTVAHYSAILVCILALSACHPVAPKADGDGDAAMRAAGYARTPEISSVAQGENGFVVEGQAIPDGRVRFTYAGQRAIGVTADSRGHYKAELPAGGLGGLYDLSIEDGGRSVHADGRLFAPLGEATKAVLIRSGSPSRPIMRRSDVVSVVDYDSAGALGLSGYVAPNTKVQVILGDEIRAEATSDANGYYTATTQIPPPTTLDTLVMVIIQTKAKSSTHGFTVSLPDTALGDRIRREGQVWRVDGVLPGGGMQTTLVF